jgi:hypothetical protein
MADIHVSGSAQASGWLFEVTVSEQGGRSAHRVRVSRGAYERLARNACPPEELVRRSFEFLLEREPKESILSEFDITLISRYFPEYDEEIGRRVRGE